MYEYALLPHLNIFSFDLLDYHYEEIHIFSENFDHNLPIVKQGILNGYLGRILNVYKEFVRRDRPRSPG